MTDSEFDKLLSEALAKYGLKVKTVTQSSYMPTTGVIMSPRGTRRADLIDNTRDSTQSKDKK